MINCAKYYQTFITTIQFMWTCTSSLELHEAKWTKQYGQHCGWLAPHHSSYDFTEIKAIIEHLMVLNQHSSPYKLHSPKAQYLETLVPDNNKAPPPEGRTYTEIGVICNIEHDMISPKWYELLIKTQLKGNTALDLNNFHKQLKVCLNAVNRLREYLLTYYQSIKRHSQFEEYFIPDRDHPSYSWNVQIYTSLGHSLLVAMTNNTCVKSSMASQAYKVFSTHAHEISV